MSVRRRPGLSVIRGLLSLALLWGLLLTVGAPAWAVIEAVPLERLHVHDVILLPTVRSQYQVTFTKPKTWQISPSSRILVEFQHSHELLPNRSWLQVIVNDKVISHTPLTRENATGTRLTLPLPVALLKDFNTLTFRVEQHYTDKCEDPLDKSLWTQILPATQIVFDYTPTAPVVNLNTYPYPVIDHLTYSPAKVHFVMGRNASAREFQAAAYINTHLAQEAQQHELFSRLTFGNPAGPSDEHLVFVGTPDHIPDVLRFQSAFGDFALQGGQWVNRRTGQALSPEQGVILFFRAPDSNAKAVLVVSGNSDQAVFKAAQYLTTRPKISDLSGVSVAVPEGWSPPGSSSAKVPRYIESHTRTFRELGFGIEEVHKINAPPITYHVPVVNDFREGGKLWLDLNLSYSPNLNPEFSSLELRMNDVSIGNIPLTNPAGEQGKRVSVPISHELVRTRNNLVAQFHLMPEKYGWCVDNYVDNAWGKIMDDSQIRVEGGKSGLPDVGLLNGTMYPYSKEDHLQNLHLVLPNNPSAELLNAMLGFTTRLGRATLADTDLRFGLSMGDAGLPGDKNLVVFQPAGLSWKLPDGARLAWKKGGLNLWSLLELPEPNGKVLSELMELAQGASLEQYRQGNRVISVFTSVDPAGFNVIAKLFNSDKAFEQLQNGFLQQLSKITPGLNAVDGIQYHTEEKDAGSWWGHWLNWLKNLPWFNIIAGLVAAFFALIILPFLIGRFLRR